MRGGAAAAPESEKQDGQAVHMFSTVNVTEPQGHELMKDKKKQKRPTVGCSKCNAYCLLSCRIHPRIKVKVIEM